MEESFACIAIGGDGTIIHAAQSALPWGKPVLGINLGRLGFLAALEPDQLEYLKKLVTGDYQLEERDGVLVPCGEKKTGRWAWRAGRWCAAGM